MKKTIKIALLFILALAFVSEVQAQARKVIYLQNYDKAPYHFGILLGSNFMDYNLMLKENYQDIIYTNYQDLPTAVGDPNTNIPISEENFVSYQITKVERDTMGWAFHDIPRAGFTIGVIGALRITDNLTFRMSPFTFSLSEINYRYTIKVNQTDGSKEFSRRSHNPYLTCLEFPMHLKYRSKRYNNVAAYLFAGGSPKLYFSFKKKGQDFNWLKSKAFDVAIEFGTGFDIYNQWFKTGVEFKFAFGLLNAMNDDQVFYYAQPLNAFKNKQFQISFTFE